MEREYSEKPKNLSQLSRKTAISERRAMFERNASSNNEQPVPQFARSYTSNRSVVNINPGRSSIAVATANSTSPVNIPTPAAASPDKLLSSNSCDTTSSTLTVGKYKLELTSQGKVVVFRGDNRTPEQIVAAGGFYPWSKQDAGKIKKELIDEFIKIGPSAHMMGHVRSPNKNYVSTGMNMDSGGFGEQSNYLYKMEIPGLKPQDMNERTLGEKIRQDSRGINYPHFLMNHLTLAESEFVAMIPARSEELTFITPIPLSYITSYRKRGTNTWLPMPLKK
ncbi:hypothetical protein [Photorhabdus heterorhabditis]|uniref:Uncharacterized protein n=1 Tax=Photorhabdus heterorhabditis TaxID=880156 RepID=A0A5B0WEB7_9GAMM|nr:hypothetical protein [Photorhabdus heterorhabditis]KAA1185414.1 hypothetical protein F0L16_14745 [Photorhabdus heterorhabditis]